VTLVTSALCGLLYFSAITKRERLEVELQRLEMEISKLQVVVNQVEQLKENKEELERQVKLVERLVKGRTKWAQVLDEFSRCVSSGLWIRVFDPRNHLIEISGDAFNCFSIANFLVNLDDSEYFECVELRDIRSSPYGEFDVKSFKINFSLKAGIGEG
jgi:Tfp pilus assembly protein PilN